MISHHRLERLWSDIGPHLNEQGARIEGRAARSLATTATGASAT